MPPALSASTIRYQRGGSLFPEVLNKSSEPTSRGDASFAREKARNQETFDASHRSFVKATTKSVVCRAAAGGFLGMTLAKTGELLTAALAAAVGAGIGAFTALDRAFSEDRGTVSITLDGRTREARFYGKPETFLRTDAELEAELLGESNRCGGLIPAGPSSFTAGPEVPALATAFQPFAPQFAALAGARRLVADLGRKLPTGETILDHVDANLARQLLAAGRPVQVLVGKGTEDGDPHSYRYFAANKAGTRAAERQVSWVDRTFRYDLVAIQRPEDLSSVTDASGLPRGFFGVVLERGQISERISISQAEASARVRRKLGRTEGYSSDERWQEAYRDPEGRLRALENGLTRVSKINWGKATIPAGALVGLLLGTALFVPSSVFAMEAGVIGALLGKKLGELLTDRSAPLASWPEGIGPYQGLSWEELQKRWPLPHADPGKARQR